MTKTCSIDIHKPNRPIHSGHLQLGGKDALGNTLELINYYLTWNDNPFFVVSGEFHYSRFQLASDLSKD